jgi:NTE family protein
MSGPARDGPVAFVLSGGGSLGAIQVGMLLELEAAGLRPDIVIGVSAGAINGAFYAHAPGPGALAAMSELWSRVSTRQIMGLSWRSLLGVLGLRDHLSSANGLRSLLERHLPYRDFSETALPLHVLCAELVTGREVVLSQGSVIDAILASAAIPGVFPPMTIGGLQLVDGAVAARTPLGIARSLNAARVVVLPCGFACAGAGVSRNALGRAMHAVTLLGARQLRGDFERYSVELPIHVVPPLCPLAQSSYDYSNGAALIAQARSSTRAWLEAGGLDSSAFPGELIEHSHAV